MIGNRKLLIYIIGLTITVLLISVCLVKLIANRNFKKEYAMQVSFATDDYYTKNYGCPLEDFLKTKKFINFTLTGNQKGDSIQFANFQVEIRNLIKTKDSIKGVHLLLNEKSKYEDLVKVFEICKDEKAKVWIPRNYDIWVTNEATSEFKKKCPLKIPK